MSWSGTRGNYRDDWLLGLAKGIIVVLREPRGQTQQLESKWCIYTYGCGWEQSCVIQG